MCEGVKNHYSLRLFPNTKKKKKKILMMMKVNYVIGGY